MTLIASAPLWPVDGPLPRRRPYDLLSTVEFVDPGDDHAQAGVQVYPYPTALPAVHNPCAGGSYGLKDEGEPTDVSRWLGFTVYLPIFCTTRGIGDDMAFRNRAVRALEATESYAVESELARDIGGLGNAHLTQGGITPLSAAAVRPSEGLALLENSIAATTARMGMIHADPATVTAWAREFLVFHEGGKLLTTNGTPVAAGAGYVGIHPADESAPSATQAWAFATGPVQALRSEIYVIPETIKEAVDRTFNDVTYYAERNYSVWWDLALLSEVLIDRSL